MFHLYYRIAKFVSLNCSFRHHCLSHHTIDNAPFCNQTGVTPNNPKSNLKEGKKKRKLK